LCGELHAGSLEAVHAVEMFSCSRAVSIRPKPEARNQEVHGADGCLPVSEAFSCLGAAIELPAEDLNHVVGPWKPTEALKAHDAPESDPVSSNPPERGITVQAR